MEDKSSLDTNPLGFETSYVLWAIEAGSVLGEQNICKRHSPCWSLG
jgi:hypothetical protein